MNRTAKDFIAENSEGFFNWSLLNVQFPELRQSDPLVFNIEDPILREWIMKEIIIALKAEFAYLEDRTTPADREGPLFSKDSEGNVRIPGFVKRQLSWTLMKNCAARMKDEWNERKCTHSCGDEWTSHIFGIHGHSPGHGYWDTLHAEADALEAMEELRISGLVEAEAKLSVTDHAEAMEMV